MPETTTRATATAVRWPVPLALAIPALIAGIVTVFSAGHSAIFGLLLFGGFGVITAAAAALGAALLAPGAARSGAVGKAVIALLGGAGAFVAAALMPSAEPAAQAAVLAITIAVSLAALGTIDIVVGARVRGSDRFGRDWITAGVLEALGAVVVAVVPPTFFQAFSFSDQGQLISGEVTSSTMMVGLFGAAATVLGVFLAIAGVGLIPARSRATA